MLDFIREKHPEFVEQWRYYQDEKSWLFKVSTRKKTVFWLSVGKGLFRTTFYFGPKAEASVTHGGIPNSLKKQYASTKDKKVRRITLVVKSKKDLKLYGELLELKLADVQTGTLVGSACRGARFTGRYCVVLRPYLKSQSYLPNQRRLTKLTAQ